MGKIRYDNKEESQQTNRAHQKVRPEGEVVVHELTHMLTRPLLESNEMEEYTVTTISRILMRMKSCLETEATVDND